MKRSLNPLYASLLLVILLAAYAGQKVHIYQEDHAHFAALCGDLLPDNGARTRICERCVVDDYSFYPYLAEAADPLAFRIEVLDVVLIPETCCKQGEELRSAPLRAPPAAGSGTLFS